LYWVALSANPPPQKDKSFFCIDNDLVYWNFFLDFGPLNLGHLYKYCALLNNKLSDPKLKDKVIFHYCGNHPHRRANSAFLIAAWSILYLNRSPEDAYEPFNGIQPPFPNWHDATPSICSFPLNLLDTLRGLYKARECGWFDFNTFNVEEYEYYEQVENGDLNWTCDGKFVAFAGPHATREVHPGGYTTLCPEDYIPYFKKKNVKLVVRLNKKYYDARKFNQAGIDHMELYFIDGSNPPDHLLAKFLERVEACDGGVAVHCKAGLGRTGCVIGCYMMKHYRATAEEIIGWFRIARPGSVIGPQQHWMKDMQPRMWREGEIYRQKHGPRHPMGMSMESEMDSKASMGYRRASGGARSSRGSQEDALSSRMNNMNVNGTKISGSRSGKDDAKGDRNIVDYTEEEESNPRMNTQGDYLRERRLAAARNAASGASESRSRGGQGGSGSSYSKRVSEYFGLSNK
jgi:cell division cycle 14